MRSKSISVAAGLVSVLVFSALGSAQGLRAQEPAKATTQTTQGERQRAGPLPGATRLDEVQQQMASQAQLWLLELQKRQLEEQGKEQIEQLEEVAKEQIEQVMGDANRQIQQLKSQLNRQSEQVRRSVKRQAEMLDAQMRLVGAQAGIRSEPMRALRPRVQATGPAAAPDARAAKMPPTSPSTEGKLDKILDRLERLEKRLDMLERNK
jgi:hypothetical protein